MHRIHIETEEDVRLLVWFQGPPNRMMAIPMVPAVNQTKADLPPYPDPYGIERFAEISKAALDRNLYPIHVSFLCRETDKRLVGIATLPFAATVENMLLTVPVRLTAQSTKVKNA